MSGIVKEWGAAAVAFCLSFALVTGIIAPEEIQECSPDSIASVDVSKK